MKNKTLLKKLEVLRLRIETWCAINGYKAMDNYSERLDKYGNVIWKLTDWEFVDNMHNTIYNDHDFGYDGDLLKRLNKMWKRYRPYDRYFFSDSITEECLGK